MSDNLDAFPGLGKNYLDVDLSIKEFKPITKFFEETPNPVFDDPSYYKLALSGEGEASQRLHALLGKYLNCQDKNDKTVYRQQMVTTYWEYLRSVALKINSLKFPLQKTLAVRYGVVLPSLFLPEQKEFFSKAVINNETYEPVLYMDEWIKEISMGHMTPSSTDEAPVKRTVDPSSEQARIAQLQSKNNGKLQSSENLLRNKEIERANLEFEVRERVEALCEHHEVPNMSGHSLPYREDQKKLFNEIVQRFQTLQRIDRDLNQYLSEYQDALEIGQSLEDKANALQSSGKVVNVAKEQILGEMNTLRQMSKMTCGRQGNQFPIFTREFFHCMDKSTGFRENVLNELAWIESIDPECFCRIHRGVKNRIVPYVLLMPSYGDIGFCWEPFDRYNRVTSRGRIVVPMYPRDLKTSCIMAVGDLRWQVAKEKASFDWMTDGLTGHYYQYLEEHKMKGDIKSFFVNDYILWITKEANGTQKLDKEVRSIFWRYMPFKQELKDELKKRSPVYADLCQKDINRSMSDGY